MLGFWNVFIDESEKTTDKKSATINCSTLT